MAAYGRDPRRYLTTEEKRLLYVRANGLCQGCGTELDASWHSAHMAGWAAGGATNVEGMQAQCPRCNLSLGARDMEQVEGLSLRLWQQLALPVILERLWQHGSATLHAAPGAGKTLFAATVFRHLELRRTGSTGVRRSPGDCGRANALGSRSGQRVFGSARTPNPKLL